MKASNPSVEEVRSWAYSDCGWPHEEWDLFLSWTREIDLFIELATDHQCPKKTFFLHMLYYIVGNTFTELAASDKLARIAAYVQKGKGLHHGDIRTWVQHGSALLAGQLKYEYRHWRGGQFAQYDFK